MKYTNVFVCFLLVLLMVGCADDVNLKVNTGEIQLPVYLTDNVVLQQQTEVPFFGTAIPDKKLTVTTSWDHKNYKTHTDVDGKFMVTLNTPEYGGPYEIAIEQKGVMKTLSNVLIGEVWLCSGQSNMEMPLAGWGKINNYEEEIANADYPEIRLLQVEKATSELAVDTVSVANGGWTACTPETIPEFSSTAYFFARKIYETKHIPVGLIHSSWGGTVIEAWTSAQGLKDIKDFDKEVLALTGTAEDKAFVQERNKKILSDWNEKVEVLDRGMQAGKPIWLHKGASKGWKTMHLPEFWENTELPDFDGVVWFQKEIQLTKDQLGDEASMHLYVDDNDVVWINGTKVGETIGYNIGRNYEIPSELLTEGANTITIRVFDGAGGGGVYGEPDQFYLKLGNEVVSLAGDWHYKIGVMPDEVPPYPYLPVAPNYPTVLYNAMINPFIKFPVKGAIWYQGEANVDRALQYQRLFPALIADWRAKFNNPDMPFYFVQLASYLQRKPEPEPSTWAELREAQLLTLKNVSNTGMAVTIDIGNADDIHPKNKQEVGARLARIALAKNYGEKIGYSGPVYKSVEKSGQSMIISFDYADSLHIKDDQIVKGVAIAGKDRVYHWANATIEGDKVIVNSDKVKDPVSVRYGWAANPDVNLFNAAGLPATPFRTDEW